MGKCGVHRESDAIEGKDDMTPSVKAYVVEIERDRVAMHEIVAVPMRGGKQRGDIPAAVRFVLDLGRLFGKRFR